MALLLTDPFLTAQGLVSAALLPVGMAYRNNELTPSTLTCPHRAGVTVPVGESVRLQRDGAVVRAEYRFNYSDDGQRALTAWPLGFDQLDKWLMPFQMPPNAARLWVIITSVTCARLSYTGFSTWWRAGFQSVKSASLPVQVQQLAEAWDDHLPKTKRDGLLFSDDPWVYNVLFRARDAGLDNLLTDLDN
jgi:hypothetical protein